VFRSTINQLSIKIGDFGLSRQQEYPLLPKTKEIMTLWYRAPEVLLDNLKYSKEIDIWSVGVIIFEMLAQQQMFRGNSEIDMLFQIFNLKGTPEMDSKHEMSRCVTNIQSTASSSKEDILESS
jgi:serine/threonine protein kinase